MNFLLRFLLFLNFNLEEKTEREFFKRIKIEESLHQLNQL